MMIKLKKNILGVLFISGLLGMSAFAAYQPSIENYNSTLNSTILTNVTGGEVFQGTGEDVTKYGSASISVWSPFAEPTAGTLTIEVSRDGITWGGPTRRFESTATAQPHMWTIAEQYFRIKYEVDAAQTANQVQVQTQFSVNRPIELAHQLDEIPIDEHEAILVKNVGFGKNPDGTYDFNKQDGTAFSTTNNLGIGGNYTSDWLNAQGFSQVQTHILASHDGTMTFQFAEASDGSDIVRTLAIPYSAANGYQLFAAPAFSDYIQYSFTNSSGSAQTDFYYETKFLTKAISPQLLRLDGNIAGGMIAGINRGIIVGKTIGGAYKNVTVEPEGSLDVSVSDPRTAFGELQVAELTPVAQVDFVYGINDNLMVISTNGPSGTVIGANQLLQVSSGASATSSASAYSSRYLKYRPGQGALGRFTAAFNAPVVGNTQKAGLFTPDLNNGFGFGYDTNGNFGIVRIDDGTENWTVQADWNIDVADGTGDSGVDITGTLTNGNVFSISYQYLGYGAIFFKIENPDTGKFTPVHIEKYAGTSQDTSVSQPSLNLLWSSKNVTNTTDVVLRGASGALFVEGQRRFLGPRYGNDVSFSVGTNRLTLAAISIKNATTFNGIPNRAQIRLRSISFGANADPAANQTADGSATLRILRDVSQDDAFTYTPIDGDSADSGLSISNANSIVSISKVNTSTIITNGISEFSSVIAVGSSTFQDLSELDIFLNPGEIKTVVLQVDNATYDPVCAVGISWSEDL